MLKDTVKSVVQSLDVDDVNFFADINFAAPELAIALNDRYGCKIDVLSVNRKNQYTAPDQDIMDAYLEKLHKAGVDESDIRIIDTAKAVRSYDVLSSVDTFGTKFKIKSLSETFDSALHGGSRVVINIKKGSGSYPFLNNYGNCNTLIDCTADQFGLVVMSFEPQEEVEETPEDWASIAVKLAGKDGFYTDCGEHSFLYIPRGKTLVVTFDNLDIAMTKRDTRRPWGFEFIEANDWSMLGVMANGWTWFRDQKVTDEFDRLKESGFFKQFSRVVFYGASMGGYAAAAYSSAAEGSTVFAISPQSTLDKSIVDWEKRYKTAWDRDFSGKYGDASLVSGASETVHIMYDPYVKPDTGHAQRFRGENVKFWRCPHLGHRLGSSLLQMGILSEISSKCINGELTENEFYSLLRKRRKFLRYIRELGHLTIERERAGLALRVASHAKKEGFSGLSRKLKRQAQEILNNRPS